MAGKNNVYNNDDSMDINELAALNDEISDDMLEQLTQQLTQDMSEGISTSEDAALFEEPAAEQEVTGNTHPELSEAEQYEENKSQESEVKTDVNKVQETETKSDETQNNTKKDPVKLDESFDDNFIKKYKAKLNKQATPKDMSGYIDDPPKQESQEEPIEKVSQGNITEKNISKEQIEYNDSLDFLDGNVKYSKYVIYVDPQNVDFIESLTVKERKNLINGILKQQGDIALTKRRFKIIETIIRHAIVAILTITISIPVIYYAINASLEATINNHRQSQTVWQSLYKENGKISTPKN